MRRQDKLVNKLLGSLNGLRGDVTRHIIDIIKTYSKRYNSSLSGLLSDEDTKPIIKKMRECNITGRIPHSYNPPAAPRNLDDCLDLVKIMGAAEYVASNSRLSGLKDLNHLNTCEYCRFTVLMGVYTFDRLKCKY